MAHLLTTRPTKHLALLQFDGRGFSALLQSFVFHPATDDVLTLHVHEQPKISGCTDNLIFEAISEEYLEQKSITPSAAALPSKSGTSHIPRLKDHRTMQSSRSLVQLVARGDFSRAESLRTEYLHADLHIQRHVVYAKAALHAWSVNPVETRTEAFYSWFSMMPGATVGRIRRCRKTLLYIRRKLFEDPSDLNTIACYGLVAARKGFANFISFDIVAHIARFASPGVSSAFMDTVEKSAKAFYTRNRALTKQGSSFSIYDSTKYQGVFIRALCFAGYLDAAVDRLSQILKMDIPVEPFTFVVLIEDITQAGREDLITIVRNLRTMVRAGEQHEDIVQDPARQTPSATYLAQMMSDHIERGNAQELVNLRDEMRLLSPDLLVTAQNKYYQDAGQHIVVLRQFLAYFMCIGIPKNIILSYIKANSQQSGRDSIHPSLPFISSLRLQGQKRWPSTHDVSMVWRSLVSLAEDIRSLEELYRSFLACHDRYPSSTSNVSALISPEPLWKSFRFQYPPIMQPDTVQFHVFIVAFARLSGIDAALQVLIDMNARGIRPDLHNWTVVAGKYAAKGDTQGFQRILGSMEARIDKAILAGSAPKEVVRKNVGPVSRPEGWMPVPNLVTYTTILRGLIDHGRLKEAQQFEARMKAAGYVPGSDKRTDEVLTILRQRESSNRVPWQERASWQPGTASQNG